MALTTEQQQTLVETNAGTPMGELFRRYWIPALLADELPAPDCPPVRVTLLGEELIAFRDSEGRLGLIDRYCPHRGVSLFFARNEQCGLRCSYHGWKFDVNGQCVDMPSEPEESNFKNKVRVTAYPLVQRGHVLWAYMGPPGERPAEPEIEWVTLPNEHVFVSKRLQRTNYLQALEGGIDSSHVSWLHSGGLKSDPLFKGAQGNKYNLAALKPFVEDVDSDGGLFSGDRRNADGDNYYWRITPWVMPCFTMIPPRGDHPIHGHFWVPIDDENCWAWSYDFHPVRALSKIEVDAMKDGAGVHCKVDAAFRPLANKDNDYLIDRAAQKAGHTYSGVAGFAMQDASLQESMGPVCDRTKENLVSTDNGIIMARHRLMRAAKALVDKGVAPPGIDVAHQKVRACSVVLPPDVAFKDGAKEALYGKPGMAQTTV